MPDNTSPLLPEIVKFVSNGAPCVAFVSFGKRGLNMHSCLINLGEKPKVNVDFTPRGARVVINEGEIWFDTDETSAAAIEALFLTGAPASTTS